MFEELQVRERSEKDMGFYRWVERQSGVEGERRGMRVRQPRIMVAGIMK